MWSAIMSGQSVTNAADLLVLKAPTDHKIAIELVRVAADVATTAVSGPISLHSASTIGTGGTTITPVSDSGSAAEPWSAYTAAPASAVAERNPSGAATKIDTYRRMGADLRLGYEHSAKKHGLLIVQPAGIFVVRLDGNLGGATTLTAEILFHIF